MCDLNWCPVCDKSIFTESDFLYCSVDCFLKDNNGAKGPELTKKFNNFLPPRPSNIHIVRESSPSLKTFESLPTMIPSSTIESLLSNEDDTEEEDKFLSCCDYCENQMGKGWDFSKSFQQVCPSYNPVWSEEMPGMEGSHGEHIEEAAL